MKFPDASGVPVNMLPISDGSVFDQLKLLVDSEGANLAGPDWLGMLAAIGIVKGQPFTPDAHTREILDQAAKTAYKTSRVIGFEEVVSGQLLADLSRPSLDQSLSPTGRPPSPRTRFEPSLGKRRRGYLALDARIWFFTNYYSVSPGMFSKIPGKGATYLIAFTDSAGRATVGWQQLSLESAAQLPAANFWSVTLYDAENCLGTRQRPAFPFARFARQAGTECRRQHRRLPRTKSTRGQSGQLARDRARQGLFRHPQAVRSHRSRHQQELEAGRLREG